jgi:hypothetical protein
MMREKLIKKEINMKTNSTITINGKTYNTNLIVKEWGNGSTYVTTAQSASILRQVLKSMKSDGLIGYKKLWVRSETFSMGCAINVYTHGGTNTELIKEVTNMFMYGSFDGMTDSYNYGDSLSVTMNDGSVNDVGAKYTSYYSSSPYGTVEYHKEEYINDCLDKNVTPTSVGVDAWLSIVND